MLHPGYLGGVKAPGSHAAESTPSASQLLGTDVARQAAPGDAQASAVATGSGTCPRCRAPCRVQSIRVVIQAWTPMLAQAVRATYTGPRDKPDPHQTQAEPPAMQRAEVAIPDVPAWTCHRCAYVALDAATETVLGAARQHYDIPQGTRTVSWTTITAWHQATRKEAGSA